MNIETDYITAGRCTRKADVSIKRNSTKIKCDGEV